MNDRTTIATQLLASVLIQDGVLCANGGKLWTNEKCVTRAIELTDMLLAKLEATAPTPSAPVATDSPTDKPRLLDELPIPKWQCLSFAKPERCQPYRVVVWDSEGGQIMSIDRLYWDGTWVDDCGDYALGDVPDLQIYWCPSHLLPNSDDAIRISFVEFIESR